MIKPREEDSEDELMSDESPHDTSHRPPEGAGENAYKDHRYVVRDDEGGFELWIDGRSWAHMVDRIGPDRYYSHLLPFVEYSSADEIAQAIIDRAGEAWVDEPGDDTPDHPHT